MLASKQLRRRHLVLVVEDQEINRDVLGMILEDDYDVLYAENGAEGLELILDIAHYLNVPVVAEGVETAEQLALLRGAGCQLVQGYYFSKPVPPEELEERITKQVDLDRRETP